MVAAVSSAVTPSLAMIRLLQGFGSRQVPVEFVRLQLGLDKAAVQQHLQELERQNVVKLDGESVSIV